MTITIIVAMDERRGIGKHNKLPWRLSSDLKRFRELTTGHHIILGRKTFESIGKALPGRQMIIVTRNPDYKAPGCLLAHSLQEALEIAQSSGETEAFICGGAAIYKQAIDLCDRIYLTVVHAQVDADVFFPDFDPQCWVETESVYHASDAKNEFAFTAKLLQRKPRRSSQPVS